MKNRKWVYPILVLVIAGGILTYNYVYQDHRDIKSEKVAFSITAANLKEAFINNEEEATTLYLNQTIELNGTLTSVDGNSLVLDNSVFFVLNEGEKEVDASLKGTQIKIKGRCIGYDSLLEEVKFDQASLIQ